METYKLNNGIEVIARIVPKLGLYPYHYMNLKQAEKAAAKQNAKIYWNGGRCFYLILNNGNEKV